MINLDKRDPNHACYFEWLSKIWKSESVRDARTVDIDGKSKGDATHLEKAGDVTATPPITSNPVRLLVPGFQGVLRSVIGK